MFGTFLLIFAHEMPQQKIECNLMSHFLSWMHGGRSTQVDMSQHLLPKIDQLSWVSNITGQFQWIGWQFNWDHLAKPDSNSFFKHDGIHFEWTFWSPHDQWFLKTSNWCDTTACQEMSHAFDGMIAELHQTLGLWVFSRFCLISCIPFWCDHRCLVMFWHAASEKVWQGLCCHNCHKVLQHWQSCLSFPALSTEPGWVGCAVLLSNGFNQSCRFASLWCPFVVASI